MAPQRAFGTADTFTATRYSADPLTNVVDVYIRQLRRKIDDDFELKLLKTVRGYGYKMDAS